VANVLPHPELKQVCGLCGAPRIEVKAGSDPKAPPVALSGRERPHLEAARAAERKRLQWKTGGIFGTASTAFVFLLMMFWALIFGMGATWLITGAVLSAPFVLLAMVGFARSKGAVPEVQAALREAWKTAARDVILAHPNGITATELAAKLPMSEADAEDIAAQLSVDNLVNSRVTSDGRLLLEGVRGARIDTGAEAPQADYVDPLEERFAELEQAEREQAAKKSRVHEP
jgi:hypothetical protein